MSPAPSPGRRGGELLVRAEDEKHQGRNNLDRDQNPRLRHECSGALATPGACLPRRLIGHGRQTTCRPQERGEEEDVEDIDDDSRIPMASPGP